jgi:hypothetical protein
MNRNSIVAVLAAIVVLAALVLAMRAEGGGVLRRLLPALHGQGGHQ